MSLTRLTLFASQGARHFSTTKQSSFLFRLTRHIRVNNYQTEPHIARGVYDEDTGSIRPVPKWYKLGLIKVALVITTFVSLGAFISKSVAAFLEDNEIFIHEEDDDDDDD
jgi:hypothetical protein